MHRIRSARYIPTFLLGIAVSVTGQAAAILSNADREALTTRTPIPQPSPELIRALDMDVPDWHKPGAPQRKVRIDPQTTRESTEAALHALEGLDLAVPQNDYDRAWIAFEKASAFRELGRDADARAAFEAILQMRRTMVQDRRTLIALNHLGDESRPGACPAGGWGTFAEASAPVYPHQASSRGIEGWVKVIADVRADGSVSHVTTESSSLSIFEPAASTWLSARRFRTADNAAPGRPCFVHQRIKFALQPAGTAKFSIDAIGPDDDFSFRSIGAARRIRGAAREAALRGDAAPTADESASPSPAPIP